MANARLEQLDYYALLKVDAGASSDAIRRAFHRFAAKYHPDRFVAAGEGAERVEQAAEIYRRGAEAYRVLCNPQHRRLYDAGLPEGRLRFDASDPEPASLQNQARFPVRVRNPAARPFALKAEQAYGRADWPTCRLNLRLALGKERENPQIEALLAMVEAQLESAP